MKDTDLDTDLAIANGDLDVIDERGLLSSPRPSIDREKLQHHLREALRLLHVDLDSENVTDTPRRWAESLVTMTSGYAYTDVKKLATLLRAAASTAVDNRPSLVVLGGSYTTRCDAHSTRFA